MASGIWEAERDGWRPVVEASVPWWAAAAQRLGRWCWSYRELVAIFFVAPQLVAAVLVVVDLVGRDQLAVLAVGLFVALGLLAAVPPSRRWLMGFIDAAHQRHYLNRIKRDWPGICRMLGWSRAYGKDSRGRSQTLIAMLCDLHFEQDGTVLVLTVKPMADQPRRNWGQMADQFRRYLGVPVARWDEPAPGKLRLILSREALPVMKYFPTNLNPAAWDRLRVGVRAGADEVCWRPSDTPHLLVGGVTKGGKGGVLRNLLHDALVTGWQTYVINPKLSGEYQWLVPLGVPVLETLAQVLELVEWLEAERTRRQELIKAAGVGSWEQVRGWDAPPLLVVVDEVSALLMVDKANKEMAKLQERISYVVTRLVQLGRSAGVHLVLATQRPDVSTLGPNGGILRDNIDGRIGVCSLQDAGVSMLFGQGLDPDIKMGLDGTKGRALATMLSAGDFDTYPLQVYWLDERELSARPPSPLVRQVLTAPLLLPEPVITLPATG